MDFAYASGWPLWIQSGCLDQWAFCPDLTLFILRSLDSFQWKNIRVCVSVHWLVGSSMLAVFRSEILSYLEICKVTKYMTWLWLGLWHTGQNLPKLEILFLLLAGNVASGTGMSRARIYFTKKGCMKASIVQSHGFSVCIFLHIFLKW